MNPKQAKQELASFLKQFPNLSEEEIEQLTELIPTLKAKKGTVLLKEGKVPQACYYVLKGLVRQYQIVEGEEKTTAFYTETKGTVSSQHFIDQSASTFYLECSEDCLLIVGERGVEAERYQQFPALMQITNQMLDQDLSELKSDFADFITASPAERYLNFLEKRKDLSNRVPLHQIASFLGMTPESLSRIRKRIVSAN